MRVQCAEWPWPKGMECWVNSVGTQRSLPSGLEDRTPVIYRGFHPESSVCSVVERFSDGKLFTLEHILVKAPQIYEVNGKWIPESDPFIHQWKRDRIEELKLDSDDSQTEETILRYEWEILRSGGYLQAKGAWPEIVLPCQRIENVFSPGLWREPRDV